MSPITMIPSARSRSSSMSSSVSSSSSESDDWEITVLIGHMDGHIENIQLWATHPDCDEQHFDVFVDEDTDEITVDYGHDDGTTTPITVKLHHDIIGVTVVINGVEIEDPIVEWDSIAFADSEDEDEDDTWMEIYQTRPFGDVGAPSGFEHWTFHRTGGGGPETGLITHNGNWASVTRTWGTPWEITACGDVELSHRHGVLHAREIPNKN